MTQRQRQDATTVRAIELPKAAQQSEPQRLLRRRHRCLLEARLEPNLSLFKSIGAHHAHHDSSCLCHGWFVACDTLSPEQVSPRRVGRASRGREHPGLVPTNGGGEHFPNIQHPEAAIFTLKREVDRTKVAAGNRTQVAAGNKTKVAAGN